MPQIIETVVEASVAGPELRSVRIRFRYYPDDPFALHLDVGGDARRGGHGTVAWIAARELFTAGLRAPAGLGDLRVRPCGADLALLEFHSLSGHAVALISSQELCSFLARTFEAVPAGTEQERVRWPGTVASLLRQST
ncbi:SsgA family sporulation/cell division regulator [Kitasatospora sp. NPDC048540]|uniref:SsgA family sporulation/cell division regulator n=1 Tax=Kitasatospora sp. NPDC048540 TaxID=3155634 RepID=UPI0033EF6A5C